MSNIDEKQTLYKRLLGDQYELLPVPVQELHSLKYKTFTGLCQIRRGKHIFARLICKFLGLPNSGMNVPIKVYFDNQNGIESWTRYFGNDKFCTRQWKNGRYLNESLLGTRLVFELQATEKYLALILKKIYFMGLPISKIFKPSVFTKESSKNNEYHFDVCVTLPIIGLLIHYEGYLKKTIDNHSSDF